MAQEFNASGVLWRVLVSLALMFLTFNTSGHSFFHWAKESVPYIQAAIAVCGIVLGIGMSRAHIRQRISGQASVDRADHGH